MKLEGGEHVDIWTLSLLHEAFHYIANVFLLCRCDCLSLLDVVDLNSLASYHVNHFHCVKISVDIFFSFLVPLTHTNSWISSELCSQTSKSIDLKSKRFTERIKQKKNRSSKHLYIFLFTSLEIFTCLTKIFRYTIAHVSLNIRSVVFNFRFNANEHRNSHQTNQYERTWKMSIMKLQLVLRMTFPSGLNIYTYTCELYVYRTFDFDIQRSSLLNRTNEDV